VLDDLSLLARYGRGLRRHLSRPLSLADCHALIEEGLRARGDGFVALLEQAVYPFPASPYARLLRQAGIEPGDVRALVGEHGLEGALDALFDAGVHVTRDEYRGRVPVRRGSLSFDFDPDETRNDAGRPEFAGRSGGSRGPGRRTLHSFEGWVQDAAYVGTFLSAFGIHGRPTLVMYPAPPVQSGLSNVLALTKAQNPVERWWCPSPIGAQPEAMKARAFAALTTAVSSLAGARVPYPRHLPPARTHEAAAWVHERVVADNPPLVVANPSAAARLCSVARDRGFDIAGTFFRMGGEPFTPAKQALLESVGARGACFYYNGELGGLCGVPCANAAAPGDVHLCASRLALSTREVVVQDGSRVRALCFTTIHPALGAIAINLLSDDFADVEERECGCEVGSLGLRTHYHSIRSFEKLTGEGVSFLGETLLELVETVLPARFGGAITDYQFAERETDGGVTRLELRVHPRVGALDEATVTECVLSHLEGSPGGGQVMTALWRATGTVQIVREEPSITRGGKVLPLALAERDQPSAASRQ
jgi:hypothetical protein